MQPNQRSPYNLYQQDDFRTSRFVVDLTAAMDQPLSKKPAVKEKVKDYLFDYLNQTEVVKKPPRDWQKIKHTVLAAILLPPKFLYRMINGLGLLAAAPFVNAGKLFKKTQRPAEFAELKPVPVEAEMSEQDYQAESRRGVLSYLIFPLVLLIMTLPIKAYTYYRSLDDVRARITDTSQSAIQQLVSAGNSAAGLDFNSAAGNFDSADESFAQAQTELKNINEVLLALGSLVPLGEARLAAAGSDILAAGEAGAKMGKNLSLGVAALTELSKTDLPAALAEFARFGTEAVNSAGDLNRSIEKINPDILPPEYRNKFIAMKEQAVFLEGTLAEFIDLTKKISTVLGSDGLRRYLVVFQNNTEARATGGFLGSYALVDFRDGKLVNMETPGGGTYDTEAGLRVRMIAPEPLWLLNPLWHLWDANWWPDWPTSARKVAWFFEKSDGPTVDGVISLTPQVLEKLLRITGPIDLTADYGVTITADNFLPVIQEFAEQKPDVTTKPKKIIGALLEKITADLPANMNQETLLALIKSAEESLNQKQILIYLRDSEAAAAIARYGWDGRMKETNRDYLMVVNSNIGGGKSDKNIRQTVSHRAEIGSDGEVTDTLMIKREHTGEKSEKFSGVRNVNWLRVYVPGGSELLSATGFVPPDSGYFSQPDSSWAEDPDLAAENHARVDPSSGAKIYNEGSKTVFANWSMIDPGETAVITLKYRLPFRLRIAEEENLLDKLSGLFIEPEKSYTTYSLLAQKQPGAENTTINSTLALDAGSAFASQPAWKYPAEITGVNEKIWNLNTPLDVDKFWAVILENK
jgi:hypothetical protein